MVLRNNFCHFCMQLNSFKKLVQIELHYSMKTQHKILVETAMFFRDFPVMVL